MTPPDVPVFPADRLERARTAAAAALEVAGLGPAGVAGATAPPLRGDGGGSGPLEVVRSGTAVLLVAPAEGVLARVDDRVGGARAARHLAVGHALARLDVPAVWPVAGIDAPIEVDGSAVTLWQLEHLVAGRASPAQVGHLAGRLHRATRDGAGCEGLEAFDPLRDVTEQLAIAELDDDEASLLAGVTDDVARRWDDEVLGGGRSGAGGGVGPWGVVHGDLHAGNVLLTRRGPLLADLELAGVGPVAYDLVAPVVAVLRYDAPASTLAAYTRAYRAPVPPVARHGVLRDAYELWLTTWALANRQLDGAHEHEAVRRLERWRHPRRAGGWSLR